LIVPGNHPEYTFPYNLDDRKKHIMDKLEKEIKYKFQTDVQEETKNKLTTYKIIIKDNDKLKEYYKFLENNNFVKEKNDWILDIK
jgi:hypothetical protein